MPNMMILDGPGISVSRQKTPAKYYSTRSSHLMRHGFFLVAKTL